MIVRDFSVCPRCGAPTVKSKAINGGESKYWYECTVCNTYINTYQPQAHQWEYHRDGHRFKANFGGFGSGKTTNSLEEFYKHLFLTPGGNTLIGANITAQYEQTIKRDLEADLPEAFVKTVNTQKAYTDFINDHRLMWRPLDDQGKLRSLTLSMFIIVEGSEVDGDIYSQLKTRLRNMAASVPLRDADGNPVYTDEPIPKPVYRAEWRTGIVESNPDSGWVRTQVLNVSDKVYQHGSVQESYVVLPERVDPATSSHITATEANAYLPADFIRTNSANKPAWWVARYLYGSFMYSEGLVYPKVMDCVVPQFDIPPAWKRIIAFDYGLSDNAAFIYGAIDPKGVLYIYKEVVTNNRNVDELSELYFINAQDIPYGTLLKQLIDPRSGPKRDYNKRTLSDYFAEKGIYFDPGHSNVEARVYRTNTYFESGRLKVMNSCPILIQELRDYKFPEKRLGVDIRGADKPVDKNNHCINGVEWICMELPADPSRLQYGVYNRLGNNVDSPKKNKLYDNEYINHIFDIDTSSEEEYYGVDAHIYI